MLDAKEISYVLAVADARNFSKAASHLHISQPSLSQYIQKIETDVGFPLFDRNKRPLVLTDIGEEYVKAARDFSQQRREFEQQIEDMMQLRHGHVSIGIVSQRGVYLLPKIIPIFKKAYPGIEVSLLERNSGEELEEALLQGEVDLIITSLPLYSGKLNHQVITKEKLLLAIPPSYPAEEYCVRENGRRKIRMERFAKEPFILMPPKMKLRTLADAVCGAAGFMPNVILETYNIYTAQHMVTEGLGVTFLFDTLRLGGKYRVAPTYIPFDDDALTTPLVIATANCNYTKKATCAFIDTLKNFYKHPENFS